MVEGFNNSELMPIDTSPATWSDLLILPKSSLMEVKHIQTTTKQLNLEFMI